MSESDKLTNKQFASKDDVFKNACKLANCEPTRRQASKFRRGLGKAVLYKKTAGRATS